MRSNVVDQPAKAEEDRLNMKAYADALTAFISNAQSPLTIALQGEWGSGKTSLMNALKSSLVDKEGAPYLGVWINTWQYALMSNPEEAILKILTGIVGQVSTKANTSEEERASLFRKVARVGGGVLSDVFKKYSGIDVEKGMEKWSVGESASDKSGVEDLKDKIGVLVKKAIENNGGKRGCLFFIDDLDRIDPPVAVQILELLKNIFDLPDCIFVLAIDYGVVVKGLKPKFGAMTPENEREFRSFFDKIIQLPFSMPVANYSIDGFLTSSLREIGFIDEKEEKDSKLCEAFTDYALQSVGTNPRSLKRLINYLSLIKLIIVKTKDKQDDADFAAWKDVLFALVSLQIQYPKVYEALQVDPDFPNWGEAFEQKWRIPALADGEREKLEKMTEFDEKWEQMLFRFCRRDTFIESRAINISKILNRIKARIKATNSNENVGDTVEWLLRLSAVTSVRGEQVQVVVENFSKSQYLKDLRWHTLGMRGTKVRRGNAANLSDKFGIHSDQAHVQSNLACSFWNCQVEGMADGQNFIGPLSFHIFHDGRSFQLRIWGEYWGRAIGDTSKSFHAIDFNSDKVKPQVDMVIDAVRDVWSCLGVKGYCGCNYGDRIGSGDIWWNVTVPFSNYEEMVKGEFPQKLRDSLAKVAAVLVSLLPYRVSVNNNK